MLQIHAFNGALNNIIILQGLELCIFNRVKLFLDSYAFKKVTLWDAIPK